MSLEEYKQELKQKLKEVSDSLDSIMSSLISKWPYTETSSQFVRCENEGVVMHFHIKDRRKKHNGKRLRDNKVYVSWEPLRLCTTDEFNIIISAFPERVESYTKDKQFESNEFLCVTLKDSVIDRSQILNNKQERIDDARVARKIKTAMRSVMKTYLKNDPLWKGKKSGFIKSFVKTIFVEHEVIKC